MKIYVTKVRPLVAKWKTVWYGDNEKKVFDYYKPEHWEIINKEFDVPNIQALNDYFIQEFGCDDVDIKSKIIKK